jgi:hypothetical protein
VIQCGSTDFTQRLVWENVLSRSDILSWSVSNIISNSRTIQSQLCVTFPPVHSPLLLAYFSIPESERGGYSTRVWSSGE